MISACFAGVWYGYYASRIKEPFFSRGNLAMILIFVLLYALLGRTYDSFLISYHPISKIIYSQSLAVFVSDAIMFVMIWLLSRRFPWIVPGLLTLTAQIALIVLWAVIAHRWYFHQFKPQKTAVIYDVREGMEKLIDEYGFNKKFEVVFTMPVAECLERLDSLKALDMQIRHLLYRIEFMHAQ